MIWPMKISVKQKSSNWNQFRNMNTNITYFFQHALMEANIYDL